MLQTPGVRPYFMAVDNRGCTFQPLAVSMRTRFTGPQPGAVLIPARARVSPVANTLHISGTAT
ncbi:hypothetical protein ACTHQ6_12425 [Arthrobacter sp. SAFR-179]|uniref:hypothetical protein n=1 Tax=Arthrobacter sp. SAFR-179 TaxID=3387279 RepID=UPI003F7B3CEE